MIRAGARIRIALMPSTDFPEQEIPAAEATSSGLMRLPFTAARYFIEWAKAHRMRAALMLTGGAAFITAAIAVWVIMIWPAIRPSIDLVTMDQILAALDRRDFPETQDLVKQLEAQGTLAPEDLGGPAFALGAVAAYEAENSTGKDRYKLFLLAVRHLEDANKRGFPSDRRAQGLFLLGKSLYETGQMSECRSVLLSAVNTSPRYRAEINALLADSYLNDTSPRLELALKQNSSLLADEKLTEPMRERGLLQRSRILLQMGKVAQCIATLDQIPGGVKNPGVAVQRGEALMYEARQLQNKTPASGDDQLKAREKLEQAIQMLHVAQGQKMSDGKDVRRSMYLTGICYLELSDNRAAKNQFISTHDLFSNSHEGVAAYLQLAEIDRELGLDMESLSEYRRVLSGISNPESYNNRWIPLDQLKSRLLAAFQYYLDAQKFEIALQFGRLMQHVFPTDQVLLFQADAHQRWAQTLMNQADKVPRNKAESIRRLGREQFRRAGVCYGRLAEILPASKKYTDQLWNGASAMLQGQDYNNAARMFRMYLKNETELRRPQALAGLGESLLALGQLDKALESLQECINLYPRDAAASQARLLAARTYEEKGEWREAQNLLLENLNSEYLTPAGKEWRDSLFTLGELLHSQGRYSEAVRRLEQAVERYPNLPETTQARYLLANCYYKMAAADQDKLNQYLQGSTNAVLAEQIKNQLSLALNEYKQVRDALILQRDNAELTDVQKMMLRNCYFAVGDVLFAQGDYKEAVTAYSTAANRYQGSPEVLIAYVQLAGAYQKLDKPQDAQNALQQAKFALDRMKPDTEFEKTTNYTRRQWAERLDALSGLLKG
jgi:TolA-binding protein